MDLVPLEKGRGGDWMKVYQREMEDMLSRGRPLSGEGHRVWWKLLALARWNNVVPGPGEVARAMGMQRAQVSRAYGALAAKGLLLRLEDGYRLSPVACWKGTERAHEYALRQYFESAQRLRVVAG